MQQSISSADTLISFVSAFIDGELLTIPELHRTECEALASVVHTPATQRAGILRNIRNVPKYKAFDELLKQRFDPQPPAAATSYQPVSHQNGIHSLAVAADLASASHQGSPFERRLVSQIPITPQAPDTSQARPYQLHPLNYYKDRPPKEWAVDEIVFDRGSSLFAGPGGSGKSAFVLDMCLSRVCNVPFLGRNVKPAFLIWVAAESLDELFPRAQAWLLCHNRSADEALPMLVLEERMPLNDPAETETFILSMNAQLAERQVTPQTHSLLIVFDTYSKCTPGSDENNTKDVKGIVEQIDRVYTLMNAHVLVICHTNADGMVKGNKALRDGVDTVWMVEKDHETIRLTNDKMRGAPEPAPLYACMRSIILDEHNPTYTAPVVLAANEKEGSLQFTSQTPIQMISVLQEHGSITSNKWQKQCEEVYHIKHTSFFMHLRNLRADKFVSEPPEGMTKVKLFEYSITEKGIELLENSSL
jgi:AAA domain